MIWKIFFISLGLAFARDIQNLEPEYLDELLASGQDDKFAELLGIEKHLVRPQNSEERSEGAKFTQASALGDILLTDEQARNALDFSYYTGSRWPNGRIPYVVSDSYNAQQKKTIVDAINDLNSRIRNVKIVPRGRENDYVFVFSGNGCYSYLGKTGGQQVLSLQSNGCVWKSTVQHEFIHAIGFTHEQNRADRDNHLKVLWDNIPQSWHSQYQKADGRGWRLIGPYDYYSIMHYGMRAPETGKDAFALPNGVDRNRLGRGQNDGATSTDAYKINTLYS